MSTTATRAYAAHAKPLWRRVLLNREAAIILALVVVYVVEIGRAHV